MAADRLRGSINFQEGQPPDPEAGLFGMNPEEDASSLILVPVPWDATSSYGRGAARAPEAIIKASHQMDLQDLSYKSPWKAGIRMNKIPETIASMNKKAASLAREVREKSTRGEKTESGIQEVNELSARVNRYTKEAFDAIYKKGRLGGVLGGDHSSPLGALQAAAARFGNFGILHIDAHFDLRPSYEGFTGSHASVMFNALCSCPEIIRLVQIGIRDFCTEEQREVRRQRGRVRVHYDQELFRHKALGKSFDLWVRQVLADLPDKVWISFDIDGLNTAYCPSTGTPVPGGLSYQEACYLLEQLAFSGRKIIGFDLCEVAPAQDGGEWDLNVGARILYQLCGATLHSQNLIPD